MKLDQTAVFKNEGEHDAFFTYMVLAVSGPATWIPLGCPEHSQLFFADLTHQLADLSSPAG
jgi:hypothetical protein